MTASVEGAADVDKALRKILLKSDPLTRKAMRSGANAVNRQIRRGVPAQYKDLTKGTISASVTKTKSDTYTARMGFKNREGRPTKVKIPAFYKAYWINYGTLANRDPSHHFTRPVRKRGNTPGAQRRGGIKPRRFFELAVINYKTVFVSAYERYMTKHLKDLTK